MEISSIAWLDDWTGQALAFLRAFRSDRSLPADGPGESDLQHELSESGETTGQHLADMCMSKVQCDIELCITIGPDLPSSDLRSYIHHLAIGRNQTTFRRSMDSVARSWKNPWIIQMSFHDSGSKVRMMQALLDHTIVESYISRTLKACS